MRERLARLGVIRSSGHEHFNGSLVVPVLGGDGTVVELYGRKITPNLRKGTPIHLYLPGGPHAGVWNLPALDWHRFTYKGRTVTRPHINYRTKNHGIGRHWPWT